MNENSLTGTIPEEIGNSASLRSFSAQQNQITGPIPSVFGSLSSLETLVGSSIFLPEQNKSLVFPSHDQILLICSLLSLVQNLFFNLMNGPVPSELGELTLLENRE